MTRTCSLGTRVARARGEQFVAAKHRVQERDELELGEGVANTDAGTGAERTVRFAHLSMLACVEINQCRVDGVEVDAGIQDERAVNLISTQITMGRRLCESPSSARRCPRRYRDTQ